MSPLRINAIWAYEQSPRSASRTSPGRSLPWAFWAGHVVGSQGRDDQIKEESCPGVEGRQQMGHGKSAALLLLGWLAEVLLQLRHVGRGDARAVQKDRAMTMPQMFRVRLLLQGPGDLENQRGDQIQRQPAARLAIGRGGERAAAPVGKS